MRIVTILFVTALAAPLRPFAAAAQEAPAPTAAVQAAAVLRPTMDHRLLGPLVPGGDVFDTRQHDALDGREWDFMDYVGWGGMAGALLGAVVGPLVTGHDDAFTGLAGILMGAIGGFLAGVVVGGGVYMVVHP